MPNAIDENRLYVGSRKEYNDLEGDEMDFVLNLSFSCSVSYLNQSSYAHLPLRDEGHSYRDFEQACDVLWNRYKCFDEEIFVYCEKGHSRSVSVASTTVALAEDRTFDTALSEVRTRRGIEVDPMREVEEYGRRYVEEKEHETTEGDAVSD
jgi:hypothetical protein